MEKYCKIPSKHSIYCLLLFLLLTACKAYQSGDLVGVAVYSMEDVQKELKKVQKECKDLMPPKMLLIPSMKENTAEAIPATEFYDFWLGETEVTVAQYCIFLNAMADSVDEKQLSEWVDLEGTSQWLTKVNGTFQALEPEYNDYPMIGVSWHGAYAYTSWLTETINARREAKGKIPLPPFSLPTEREWAWAAQGSPAESLESVAVADGLPNQYGLKGMAGNAAEWCSSFFHYEPSNAKSQYKRLFIDKDPTLECVVRGGYESMPKDIKGSNVRRGLSILSPAKNVGFRVYLFIARRETSFR